MVQLITYLTFNGNCREAMEYYRDCLGGELRFQTVGHSPESEMLPGTMKELIVHASLRKDKLILMGTDLADQKILRGNSVSVLLKCNDEFRIKTLYNNLKVGGKATHPLQETHWGDLFGGLTDRFGIQWLFLCKRKVIPGENGQ